jgi:hypothetical protein
MTDSFSNALEEKFIQLIHRIFRVNNWHIKPYATAVTFAWLRKIENERKLMRIEDTQSVVTFISSADLK